MSKYKLINTLDENGKIISQVLYENDQLFHYYGFLYTPSWAIVQKENNIECAEFEAILICSASNPLSHCGWRST